MKLPTVRNRLHRDERGVAIVIVMMVGMVLVMVSSIMVARGFRQLVNTSSDTQWDQALFAAESGLDQGLAVVDYDFSFTTGDEMPDGTIGTDSERGWATEAADTKPDTDVVQVPGGEYVLVRPLNQPVLFAVGYSPSRLAVERRVRVVRATIDGVPWEFTIEHALLVGGDLDMGGNTTVNDLNSFDTASVHTNAEVFFGGSYSVEGCLTATVSSLSATATCPPSPLPPEPMPVIEPLLMYPFAHYALCADGSVFGGPLHATDPDPDLVPCSGNETVVALVGWTSKTKGASRIWSTNPSATTDGVFYIDNGSFDGSLGSSTEKRYATVILSSASAGACTVPATGNLELGANSNVEVHPSLAALGYDLLFIAQGDVDFKGGATVGGAILAHEQIDYRGDGESWGAVVAVGACDTAGSPVHVSTMTGNSTINYPGPVQTPFTASTLRAEVVGWYEL